MSETTTDPVAAYLTELNERTALRRQSDEITGRLLAAVEAVLARHQPGEGTVEIHTLSEGWHRVTACAGCEDAWPCSDYEAIAAELLGEGSRAGAVVTGTGPQPPTDPPPDRVVATREVP